MLARDLETTGTFHEYYLPETGEPVHNPQLHELECTGRTDGITGTGNAGGVTPRSYSIGGRFPLRNAAGEIPKRRLNRLEK